VEVKEVSRWESCLELQGGVVYLVATGRARRTLVEMGVVCCSLELWVVGEAVSTRDERWEEEGRRR